MAVGSEEYTMKNLNEKTNAEIEGFLKKSKEELFNLRFQHATGQLENTARLKAVKRDIARMYTVLRERELGITKELIDLQVKTALAGIPAEKMRHVVIAYEPLWAIGTGRTATPEQANEVNCEIRTVIRKLYGARVARSVTILYGGSMNDKNAYELLAQPDIDGGLIGGAALKPGAFTTIINAANQE